MEIKGGFKQLGLFSTTTLSALMCLLVSAQAQASPVLVFECDITQERDLVPPGVSGSKFTIRRHAVEKPFDEEFVFTDWSLGRFSDNGRFEVEVTPGGQSTVTEKATSIRLAILDGRNGERDEVLDEALATGEENSVEGFTLNQFSFIVADLEGNSFDNHLEYPESFELADYEQKDCTINWRAPAPAPCPDNPGIVCDSGIQIGVISAFSTEEHGPDDVHSFTINSGLNDAWVNAGAALQGMFITVFEDLGLVFLAWFTFDTGAAAQNTIESAGQSTALAATFGADDQRWVTAVGAFSGNQAVLNAELTTGGTFNSSDPTPTQDTNYGEIVLEFDDCKSGKVTFDFPSAGQSGEFPITRTLEDNVALCEAQAAR